MILPLVGPASIIKTNLGKELAVGGLNASTLEKWLKEYNSSSSGQILKPDSKSSSLIARLEKVDTDNKASNIEDRPCDKKSASNTRRASGNGQSSDKKSATNTRRASGNGRSGNKKTATNARAASNNGTGQDKKTTIKPKEISAKQNGPGQSSSNQSKPGQVQKNKSAKSSNNGGGNGKGGGGKGGDSNLHQTSENPNFRKIFAQTQANFKASLISVGVFSIVANMLILAIPIYLFQISDRVLTSRSVDTLIMLSAVVIGALFIHTLLDMVRRYLLMRLAVRVEVALGAPILSSAISITQTGSNKDFQSLLDLQQIRNFITGSVMITFFDALIAPVYFLAVFMIHPHLGVILITASFILLCVAIINQKITAVPFARASGFNMRANLQADAMARNSLIINAMGMVHESVLHWGRETAQALISQVNGQDRNIIMAGISKFIRLAMQVSMLGWGAFLAIGGELTGGMVIAASIVSGRALAPVIGSIEGWRGFVQARAGYGRIKALLMNSQLNQNRLKLPKITGRLEIERLLYVPPSTKKVVLNGIGFTLEPGESLAVVGPSGTGKTTLARMLVGAMAPTAGNIRLDKMDIRNWDQRQFGETIGYLPQDVELFPTSIKANIARMREDVEDSEIFDAAELAGVHEMISQLPHGYETQINIDGSPLSGGQKQRIGLARAFFGDPKLVILDEPNSNLDGKGEKALANALAFARQRKITVVAITQRPSLLKSVDKILMLKEGRVHAFGLRDDILAKLSKKTKTPQKVINPPTDKTDPSFLGTLGPG